MPEKDRLQPVTPLGQKFEDMKEALPIAALLRSDFAKTLELTKSAAGAVQYLGSVYNNNEIAGNLESFWQSPRIGGIDPRPRAYFSSSFRSPEHFKALFEILKACGYKKEESINAGSIYIQYMARQGYRVGFAEQERLGEIALRALEEVYATQ